jgi:hypothetical protein
LTDARVELGIANTRRKLEALGLDEFVGARLDSKVGNFHFLCTDVDGLLLRLREMGWVFEGDRKGRWHLREPVARLSLHIKHFRGWPPDQLQAHVDPYGMVGPLSRLLHACTARGYRRVERIAGLLDR